ncbi:hypothetical protein RJT34_07315 [Clitoria ternatea]|uniref:Uncharacterized protein n=1 Tax=Clitoria ternatea TaxID=43366 RepID=A0AAN9K573_CLITE
MSSLQGALPSVTPSAILHPSNMDNLSYAWNPHSSSSYALQIEQLNFRTLKPLNLLVQLVEVFSWEPIQCHDMVDMGWSRLSDLNVHEGKLLGCSYNQSCVGVWVVDILHIEPYALNNVNQLNGHSETKSSSGNMTLLNEIKTKARLSISQSLDPLCRIS